MKANILKAAARAWPGATARLNGVAEFAAPGRALTLGLPCDDRSPGVVVSADSLCKLAGAVRPGEVLRFIPSPVPALTGDACYLPLSVLAAGAHFEPLAAHGFSAGEYIGSVDGAELARACADLLFAVCKDETRTHLRGLICQDGMVWTTDGHRAAGAPLPGWTALPEFIPVDVAKAIGASVLGAGSAQIYHWRDAHAEGWSIRGPGGRISWAAPEVSPPPMAQVIAGLDSAPRTRAVDDGAAMADRVARHAKLARATHEGPGEPVLLLAIGDHGLTVGGNATDGCVAVNARYLAEAFKGSKGLITVWLGGPMEPIALRRVGGRIDVIMPVRQ